MFKKYQTTAEVFRPGYIIESGYQKSGYTTTGESYIGHLKAQSIEKTTDLAMFGKVFSFHTEIGADIEEGDRLKINNIEYDVKGVSNFTGISFSVKQILLNKA